MKKKYLFIVPCLFALLLHAQLPDRTVNFSITVGGAVNYTTITDALYGLSSPATIWVAAGLYKEDEIVVPAGIVLIGGFPEYAETYEQRIYPGNAISSQQSILDGDYAHRVATVYGTLDGFVITKGYVFDSIANSINGAGGGVLIDGGTVKNCIIHNNVASEVTPSPATIPGTFVASIGDIYCTDGTILQPLYSLNQQGKIVATLEGGIPADKVPQGIVFYVDPSPTSNTFYVMAKVSTVKKIFFNPTFDVPGIPNYALSNDARADFNGRAQTDSLNAYIPRWIAQNGGNPWYNHDYATKYVNEYNIPVGTTGQWHLPSGGELYKMWEVFPQMEACARDVLGWTTAQTPMFKKDFYVSSTEYDNDEIWALTTYSYPWGGWGLDKGNKTTPGYVVPITVKSQNQD
ncbi:MAG: hypothetical protein PHD30_06850 [Paludibacter sp.]|nr:hypothetical protein [Paludibacter sp.]